jgi:hypothetical protein
VIMKLVVESGGTIRCIYSEAINLSDLGQLRIRRGSYVEPDCGGRWLVDLAPVAGPLLGPFGSRTAALVAETVWLTNHWLLPATDPAPLSD